MRVETARGPEWTDGVVTVTPIARSVIFGGGSAGRTSRPVGPNRGIVSWSWPVAVEVSSGKNTHRTRIVDVTRCLQTAIVLIALLVVMQVRSQARKRKERS